LLIGPPPAGNPEISRPAGTAADYRVVMGAVKPWELLSCLLTVVGATVAIMRLGGRR